MRFSKRPKPTSGCQVIIGSSQTCCSFIGVDELIPTFSSPSASIELTERIQHPQVSSIVAVFSGGKVAVGAFKSIDVFVKAIGRLYIGRKLVPSMTYRVTA